MKIVEKNLDGIFAGSATFEIPSFQRVYVWRKKQFSQLWEDVVAVLDGERDHHYMGTLMFEPRVGGRGRDTSRCIVVDGQQRIITFSIILRVLYDIHESSYSKRVMKISVVRFFKYDGDLRVMPSVHDTNLTELLKLGGAAKIGRGNSRECYDFFMSAIKNRIEDHGGQNAKNYQDIFKCITKKLKFVEMRLSESDDVYAIFETLNGAGVPLTPADLAKNMVLGMVKNKADQQRIYEDLWRPLESMVGGDSSKAMPDFLRHVLIVEEGRYISKTNLFHELKRYFGNKSIIKIEENLEEFLSHACSYERIVSPEKEIDSVKIRSALTRLSTLKMSTFYPVLLVLYKKYNENEIDVSDMVLCIRYIESFVVRRVFSSKVSRDLSQIFSRISRDFSKNTRPSSKSFAELLANEKWPNDIDFSRDFCSSMIYKNAPSVAKYVLVEIEKTESKNEKEFKSKEIQIEHIYPQSPRTTDNWNKVALIPRLHTMGNLTLTGSNREIANKSFLDKKKHYKKSAYNITKSVAKSKQWTDKEVDLRARYLLRKSKVLWPYCD